MRYRCFWPTRAVLVVFSVLVGCTTDGWTTDSGARVRSRAVHVDGDEPAWLRDTREKRQAMESLPTNERLEVEWPPPTARRVVDISIDVTGSCYSREVLFMGTRVSVAEHNARLLLAWLGSGAVLQPGDVVRLRLFGAAVGTAGSNVQLDDSRQIDVPARPVVLRVRRPSRTSTIEIRVLQASEAPPPPVEEIGGWILPRVARDARPVVQESPFFDYVRYVLDKVPPSGAPAGRLLVFVTDGFVGVGGLELTPRAFRARPGVADRILQEVDRLGLKPFANAQPDVNVVLFGLKTEGDSLFRTVLRDVLTRVFHPQSVRLDWSEQ